MIPPRIIRAILTEASSDAVFRAPDQLERPLISNFFYSSFDQYKLSYIFYTSDPQAVRLVRNV